MAEFTWSSDYGAAKRSQPQVQSVKFGDGYQARNTFGLNTNPKTWDLTFALRDETEANEIDDFLDDKAGVTAFEWTPPGASESSNFICSEWTRTIEKPNVFTIQATFTEVFDP